MKARSIAASALATSIFLAASVTSSFATSLPHAKRVTMGSSPLVITTDYGSPGLTENFNPYSSTHLVGANYMYEPLFMVNSLNGKQTPWLATGYKWVNTKKLVFTLRSGVKWSNGTPFTAKDVAFTFNLMHKFPALDSNALWSVLQSVVAHGDQVIFNFKTVNVPDWYYIATTHIVNAAQFEKVPNPVTFTDPNPVVTGPFVVGSFTPQEYKLTVNPLYWQRDKVHIPAIESIALTTNTITDEMISQGKVDSSSQFVPNQNSTFIARDPQHYFSWQPLGTPWTLFMNLKQWPFNQLKFREAMAYAINRTRIVKQGEYDYMAPSHQAVLPPAMQAGVTNPSLNNIYNYHYDPTKAAILLKQMGLKKNAQGQLLGKNGQQLSLTLQTPAGWTDIIQDCEFIAQDLGKLGINVHVETPSVSTTFSNLQTGQFQMADVGVGGAQPWFIYHAALDSQVSAPIGKIAPSNFERWINPKTDQLLAQYASTTNPKIQKADMVSLQKIMLTELPLVPLDFGVWWNQYTTLHYTGWPTAQNPYAAPSNFAWPDYLLVLTHLQPVK